MNSVTIVMIAELLPAERRARGQAWAGIAGALGSGIALLVVTNLAGMPGGWRWAWAAGALPVLGLPLLRRVLPETAAFMHAAARGETSQAKMLDLFQPPHRRTAFARIGTIFLGTIPGAAAGNWVFYHVVHTLGLSPAFASATLFLGGGAGMAGFVLGFRVSDGIGRKPTLILAGVIAPLAAYAFYGEHVTGNWQGTLRLVLAFTALSIAGNASLTAGRALGAELFPTRMRSTYYGWVYVAESASMIVGQFLVASLALALGGLASAILWLQLLALPSLVLFWWFVPETVGRELDPTDG
jgi:MFS family permease